MLLSRLPRKPLLGTWVNRGLVCLVTLQGCIRTQPQREVLGLHGLPHHPYQFAIECLQVRLIAQLGGERLKGLSRIVLTSVEAPVHERLEAASQRVEQRCDHKGRGDHGYLGLLLLAGERAEDRLCPRHTSQVGRCQQGREGCVNEGAVDENVYLVEAVPQYGDANGQVEPHVGSGLEQGPSTLTEHQLEAERSPTDDVDPDHYGGQREPLQLLALHPTRPPIPEKQRDRR